MSPNWAMNIPEWDTAEAAPSTFKKTIPDGQRKAVIKWVEVSEEKPMIKFGVYFPDYDNIERTKVIFFSGKMEYVKRELASVGMDAPTIPEVIEKAKASVGKVVILYVRTKPNAKYSDMFFNSDTGERVEIEAPANFDVNATLEGWDA